MRWSIVVAAIASGACGRIDFDNHDSLVGYWPFEETTADRSAAKNDGSVVGAASFTDGRVGRAIQLDGTSFIRIGDAASLDFSGSFSVAFWVREDSTGGDFDMGWYKGGSSAFYRGYDMELGGNGWVGHVTDTVVILRVGLGATLLATWVHLAMVVDRDADVLRGYVDGIESADSPAPLAGLGDLSSMNPASIGGRDNGTGADLFIGAMDEVRVYDRALSPDEIAMLAR